MQNSKLGVVIPLVMIAIGTGALLTNLKVVPQIDWIWTMTLAMAGLALPASIGFDKVTFVACAVFLSMAGMSILRQLSLIDANVEIPALVIWLGILLLVARSSRIPNPSWLENRDEPQE